MVCWTFTWSFRTAEIPSIQKIQVRHLCSISSSCWRLFYRHFAHISVVNKIFCLRGLCTYSYGNHRGHVLLVDRQESQTHSFLHSLFWGGRWRGTEVCNARDEWTHFILCSILNESLAAHISPYFYSITSTGQSVVAYGHGGLGNFVHACRTGWG